MTITADEIRLSKPTDIQHHYDFKDISYTPDTCLFQLEEGYFSIDLRYNKGFIRWFQYSTGFDCRFIDDDMLQERLNKWKEDGYKEIIKPEEINVGNKSYVVFKD